MAGLRRFTALRPPRLNIRGARTITTFAGEDVRRAVHEAAGAHAFARDDLALLERSERRYHFQRSRGNSFSPMERHVNLRDLDREAVSHEMHHAAQHESHASRHGIEAAETIARRPADMMAMERSALATGMMVQRGESRASSLTRSDLAVRWPQYAERYGTTTPAASSALAGRFHAHSRERLSSAGLSGPGPTPASGSSRADHSGFMAFAALAAVATVAAVGFTLFGGGGKGGKGK